MPRAPGACNVARPDPGTGQCAAPLIARHKIPRYIWLLNEPLPRNANGKYLKRELRDALKVEDAA